MDILNHKSYLLIVAHSDDELYCSSLLRRIIEEGNNIDIIQITKGDQRGNAQIRKDEMKKSIQHIGISDPNLIFIDIPELEILSKLNEASKEINKHIERKTYDAILSVDYESGHEGHDCANFLSSNIARNLNIKHYVYPIYHTLNRRRVGAEFINNRSSDFLLKNTEEEKDLKIRILESHISQLGSFLSIQKNDSNFFKKLFKRELYRIFNNNIEYSKRPNHEIGYEYHRNGFKFDDFREVVLSLE